MPSLTAASTSAHAIGAHSATTHQAAASLATPASRERRLVGPFGSELFYESRKENAPLAVYLHAMCGAPDHFALTLENAISPHAALLIPEANRPCASGAMWSGDGNSLSSLVESSVERAEGAASSNFDRNAPRMVIGFSQGAAVALRIAKQSPGRYRSLLLIAMQVDTSADELKLAGVDRIVLAAGNRDGSKASMQQLTAQLSREGFPARFVVLGEAGHWIPLDGNELLREPIAWLAEPR